MENSVQLLRETAPVGELADRAIRAVVNGDIDPLTAFINIKRMKAAIEVFEKDKQVQDITLRELAKYGQRQQFGDCILEEAEVGVRYDFSACGDSVLADLYAVRDANAADIKAREAILKAMPTSGMADPETGEVIYPPARSSKTTIKTTFKNK